MGGGRGLIGSDGFEQGAQVLVLREGLDKARQGSGSAAAERQRAARA